MEKDFYYIFSTSLFYVCFVHRAVPLSECWKTVTASIAPITTPFFPLYFIYQEKIIQPSSWK